MRNVAARLTALVALLSLPALADPSPVADAEPLSIGQLDDLWAHRHDPQASQALEPRLREALKKDPQSFELLWRAARERAWVADNAPDPRLKRQAGKEAWNYAERALKLKPERAEGHYYVAIGIGAHASGIGVFQAISRGLGGQFLQHIEKAAAIDPKVDRGGPLLALGRYYYTMPWPQQDLDKAEQYYAQVLQDFPENLRARHYLAQLKMKQNHKEEARALVQQVKAASVDYDPAEGRRVQSWVQRTEDALK